MLRVFGYTLPSSHHSDCPLGSWVSRKSMGWSLVLLQTVVAVEEAMGWPLEVEIA